MVLEKFRLDNAMINLNALNYARNSEFEKRVYGVTGNAGNGVFVFKSCVDGDPLRVIASDGDGWDHVSVSRIDRIPTYEEMEQIASLIFQPDETAVQYHVPKSEHVNYHPFCLHWWRPTRDYLPKPPSIMVAPK
jgi:hypothetical protein